MNEDQIIDLGQQQHELFVTDEAREGLKTAASWSMGLAILGFVGVGFMVLAGVAMLVMSSFLGKASTDMPFPFWIISLFYLLIAALYFFPLLFLFRFGSKMKNALLHNDNHSLTESCANLGKHYKYLGIMVIILIGLYLVAIFAAIAFGASMGSMF